VQATETHPFQVVGQGMTAAGNLKVGDQIERKDGESAEVESIALKVGSFPVYNLEVADAHTYFVGQQELLVHNGCAVAATVIKNSQRQITRVKAQITKANLGGGTGTTSAARATTFHGDDAGHIIGKQLGGKGGASSDNIFSQNPHINRGDFAQHETRIANLVRDGHNVEVDVQLNYNGSRVDSITYDTYINGALYDSTLFGN